MSKTISLYVNNKPLILLPKQKLLFNATEKEVLFSGGFGSAKTLALAVTALKHATIPNNQILIAKKTLISLKGTTLHTLLSILPPNSYKYYKAETKLTINGGGTIYCKPLDDLLNIRSMNLGAIFVDEASQIDLEDYKELLYRLRLNVGKRQIFLATNPATPSHWIYKRFFAENSPNRKVITTSSYDNIHNPVDYYDIFEEDKKNNINLYKRNVLGEWTTIEGAVYDNFERDKHVKSIGKIAYDKITIGIDYGYTDPTAMIVIGSYGELNYVIEEYYHRRVLLDQLKAKIKNYVDKYADVNFVVDPSAALIIAEIEGMGYKVQKANNNIIMGIGAVRSCFAPNNANIPSLVIDSNCINLIRELESYIYEKGTEKPVDKDNHALDALRYAIMGIREGRIEDSSNSVRVTLIED